MRLTEAQSTVVHQLAANYSDGEHRLLVEVSFFRPGDACLTWADKKLRHHRDPIRFSTTNSLIKKGVLVKQEQITPQCALYRLSNQVLAEVKELDYQTTGDIQDRLEANKLIREDSHER